MVESGDEKKMTVPPGDEEVDQEEVAAELESELAAGDSGDDGDGGDGGDGDGGDGDGGDGDGGGGDDQDHLAAEWEAMVGADGSGGTDDGGTGSSARETTRCRSSPSRH